jgi:hypothetical protein
MNFLIHIFYTLVKGEKTALTALEDFVEEHRNNIMARLTTSTGHTPSYLSPVYLSSGERLPAIVFLRIAGVYWTQLTATPVNMLSNCTVAHLP